MKKIYVSFVLSLLSSYIMVAQSTYEIKAQGLTYNPTALSVLVGDKVVFNAGSTHPVLEVNQETWNANGSAALDGGFSFPGGSGEIVFQSPGIYYYICTSHIASGMKGTIEVNEITTSLEISHLNQELTLFPNPLYGNYLRILYQADKERHVNVRLIDINGRNAMEIADFHIIRGENDFVIETKNIKPGVYFFEMSGSDLHLNTRILKMQ